MKTRLIPVLGDEGACQLHENLLEHCLSRTRLHGMTRQFWITGAPGYFIHSLVVEHELTLYQQQGKGLGARMAHAITSNLGEHDAVIIIGTDCPALDVSTISEALHALSEGNDVVLAPAEDGGYVLVGMTKPVTMMFDDIDWGSDSVMTQTRERLREAGIRWHELGVYWDVDRPADLQRLNRDYASIGVSVALPQSDHEPG